MRRLIEVFLPLTLALAAFGCEENLPPDNPDAQDASPPSPDARFDAGFACRPDEVKSCPCAGSWGIAICRSDRSGFGECACPPDAAIAPADAGSSDAGDALRDLNALYDVAMGEAGSVDTGQSPSEAGVSEANQSYDAGFDAGISGYDAIAISCGLEDIILGGECPPVDAAARSGFPACISGQQVCIHTSPLPNAACTSGLEGYIEVLSACNFKPGCANGFFACRKGTWVCEAGINTYSSIKTECLPPWISGIDGGLI